MLRRVPVHLPYNLAILDRARRLADGLHLARSRARCGASPISANRQAGTCGRKTRASPTRCGARRGAGDVIGNPNETLEHLSDRFLQGADLSPGEAGGWGTVYTACYRPAESRSICVGARIMAAIDRHLHAGRARHPLSRGWQAPRAAGAGDSTSLTREKALRLAITATAWALGFERARRAMLPQLSGDNPFVRFCLPGTVGSFGNLR